MVVDEVNVNSQLLLFNLRDMLDSRKNAVDMVNRIYGTNISVELSEEYRFIEEGGYPDAETQNT